MRIGSKPGWTDAVYNSGMKASGVPRGMRIQTHGGDPGLILACQYLSRFVDELQERPSILNR